MSPTLLIRAEPPEKDWQILRQVLEQSVSHGALRGNVLASFSMAANAIRVSLLSLAESYFRLKPRGGFRVEDHPLD